MAKVTVWNDVSKQFAEIDERHLAHPVLGVHYHIARLNDAGKPYIPTPSSESEKSKADK